MPRKKIICMLFDDDFDNQELFGHALKHLDISADFVTENDGTFAIDQKATDSSRAIGPNPHFIFVESDTPKMRGVDCLVEIKKISTIKTRPVYLYSTYANPKTMGKSGSIRAVELFKGHDMAELEKLLLHNMRVRKYTVVASA